MTVKQTQSLEGVRKAARRSRPAYYLWALAAFLLPVSVGAVLLALGRAPSAEVQSKDLDAAAAQNVNARPRLEIKNPLPGRATVNRPPANEPPRGDRPADPPAPAPDAPFYLALEKTLAARQLTLAEVCPREDPVARRVLEDYGAVFVAAEGVVHPPVCVFGGEADAAAYQNMVKFRSAVVGRSRIELQPAAMEALLAAREEALQEKLDITPRGGAEAARRTYTDTVRLWDTRFLPALAYWSKRGRLSGDEVARLKRLPLKQQVVEVLELEKKGIFFSKDFSKSILYSIAAPGTSQHMTGLALDVSQYGNARVRQILERHGWFQTVKSDLPHFTYLGVGAADLPALGLRPVRYGSQTFWIPDVGQGR